MRKVIGTLMGFFLVVGLFGSPAVAASDMASATFFVPATAGGGDALSGTPWFDSGLQLKPGTMITISANGLWKDCFDPDCGSATPDGAIVQYTAECSYIAPELPASSLLARTDQKPTVFVGSGPTTIEGGGKLRFAINDCYYGDNTGGFNVTVTYPADSVMVNPAADVTG